jgi:hypothetical protein
MWLSLRVHTGKGRGGAATDLGKEGAYIKKYKEKVK